MAKRSSSTGGKRRSTRTPLRYAHPFFDRGMPTYNAAAAEAAGGRMREYVKQYLHVVPKPKRDPRFDLSAVIAPNQVNDIQNSGMIIFQTGGDTGMKEAANGEPTFQERVTAAMTREFDIAHHTNSPAFFFHLGDVIYGPQKRIDGYKEQFYIPYKNYPGKIISIAGNHDGDWYPTDNKPLQAWLENFCSSQTSAGATEAGIFRQMPDQPGVYWHLEAPFAQFIGLYSNKLENPGFISGPKVGKHQRDWLLKTLKAIKEERQTGTRKALFIATHHPPYSSGGHSGSPEMLKDIDDACRTAGVWPDLFLSGHAHSYQRYTRRLKIDGADWEVPYLVIGCSGHGGQTVPATDTSNDDVDYASHYKGWGYSTFQVSPEQVSAKFYGVDNASASHEQDKFTLDLATHRVS